ncbi:NUDIX hydrolase [Pontibacillus halophilus JSM 076056 = DSM 19796]|uniref:NUDIX hydrolase n=1 Tax=Pontibacillus halophilus JSM 076056 = DSM 19796 TaxID=1385510 RepID=A0A0A5I8F0_9BACI|nr:NUDIX hydrolase [Pontibacillus halophilus]KGX92117.1 NUDIX hydrolase [Pontibacillus halophilus JSM 076056 = DSM 19796]
MDMEHSVVTLVKDEENFILIKQWRNVVQDTVISLPGGGVEEGECLEHAARREVREEIGYVCGNLKSLGSFYPSPWESNECTHVYFTDDIVSRHTPELEEGEEIEVYPVLVDSILEQIKEGRLTDGELCFAVFHALLNREQLGISLQLK